MAVDAAMQAKRLRVLMVTARYFPLTGGTETHVHEVATRLARAGHDITVLTSDTSNKLPKSAVLQGVKILRVRAWPRHGDLYFAPGVFRAVTAKSWDLIHIQGYHTFVAPIAMMAAIFASVPFIVTFHSGGHSSHVRNGVRDIQSKILGPLVSRAKRLLAVSKFEAETFSRRMGLARDLFTIVPNGAQLSSFNLTARERDGDVTVVSVGRLEKYKGHHRAISAMPHLLQRVPQARLRIVGGGPYESELRALVDDLGLHERVTIGAVPPSDREGMARLLSSASLTVLFSDYEAHPVAVMEALSVGSPALVTSTSGLKELADEGLAASVSLDASPVEIAEAMAREIASPRQRAPFVLPNWDDCATRLEGVYRAVIKPEAVADIRVVPC